LGKKQEVIIKEYTFSTEERDTLEKLEIGLISFEQAVMGMQLNKNMFLQTAYRRCGIEDKPREGFDRTVRYNLRTAKITVTLTPKEKE